MTWDGLIADMLASSGGISVIRLVSDGANWPRKLVLVGAKWRGLAGPAVGWMDKFHAFLL